MVIKIRSRGAGRGVGKREDTPRRIARGPPRRRGAPPFRTAHIRELSREESLARARKEEHASETTERAGASKIE